MRIYEKSLKNNFEYSVEEIFGKIVICSLYKLDADMLDLVISRILNLGKDKGKIKTTLCFVNYKYNRKSQWEDFDEKKEKKLDEIIKKRKYV